MTVFDAELPGPAMTAVGVAIIRAAESRRADRLYDDPWARAFADAAAGNVPAAEWQRVCELADVMYEGRTIGVRLVDDVVLAAVARGCSQVVLLGAGLDTHAWRLAWPRPIDLFEVDLPALFAFKERVISGATVGEHCQRRVVAVDLAADWTPALLHAGFRPDAPTCWIDHVSVSSPHEAALDLARSVTQLSSPGSRYSFPMMNHAAIEDSLADAEGAKKLYRGDASTNGERGLGSPGIALLRGAGWTVDCHDVGEAAASYGRPGVVGRGAVNVVAVRQRPAESHR